MKYILTTMLFSLLLFSNLSADSNLTKEIKKKEIKKTVIKKKETKIIIGATEHIKIEPPELILRARIDTGAKTTSMDARNITPFERDGKRWVKFSVYDGEKEYKVERPVYDTVLIKRHGNESQRRYMVKIRVSIDEVSQLIPVSLTDRSSYEFPILIGRNFLKDYFMVDVSKNNLLKKVKKSKKNDNKNDNKMGRK
jgi:hypothetical protein